MAQLFTNNAWGTLASQAIAGATSLTLNTGQGARFPSPTGGDYFLLTLIGLTDASETSWEIVKCTARSTDTLTVTRAQEGTSAATWAAGTRVELRVTAAPLLDLGQLVTLSKISGNAIVADGSKWGVLALGNSATKDTGTGSTNVATGDHTHASLYQPLDSDLTAVAGLSTTGLIERTGSGTAGIVTVTAAGKALLDDADAAAQRTTLGLGNSATKDTGTGSTNVATGDHTHASLYQPLDSDLTAVAGLSTTGLIERTGTGTAGTVTVTTAGKAILDDADAAAQRTTLGLGTAATMAGPSGTIVGTSDTQTLSNKTLTAPVATGVSLFGYTDTTQAGFSNATIASVWSGANGSGAPMSLAVHRASIGFGCNLILRASKTDTIGVHAALANGDPIGGFQWMGSDGNSWESGALIRAQVDGTVADGDFPTAIAMHTRPAGVGAITVERLVLSSTGSLFIRTSADAWKNCVRLDTTVENALILDSSGNLGIGATSFGTSAAKVLSLFTGTAPTTGPADTVQFYSTDRSAGNTIPSFFCEGSGVVVSNSTAAATNRIAMRINGTIYYLLANTAA